MVPMKKTFCWKGQSKKKYQTKKEGRLNLEAAKRRRAGYW